MPIADAGRPIYPWRNTTVRNPARQTTIVMAQAGPTYRVANDLVTFKAVAADTNGAYALFEICTGPGGGMPPHRQRYTDEAFWVLEGVYRFLLDTREVRLGAGDYARVPRGTAHGYTNSGATPARMLVLATPGGIHERFFAEAGEVIEMGVTLACPPDIARLARIAPNYGIELLCGS